MLSSHGQMSVFCKAHHAQVLEIIFALASGFKKWNESFELKQFWVFFSLYSSKLFAGTVLLRYKHFPSPRVCCFENFDKARPRLTISQAEGLRHDSITFLLRTALTGKGNRDENLLFVGGSQHFECLSLISGNV